MHTAIWELWVHARFSGTPPPPHLEVERIENLEVVRDDEGVRVWTRYEEDTPWVEATLQGLFPGDTNVRLGVTYGEEELGTIRYAVLDGAEAYRVLHEFGPTPAGRLFEYDPEDRMPVELRLERAPTVGAPMSDDEAMERTVAFRWMKTCPDSWETCFLWGPSLDVETAQDPALPPGGWNLLSVLPSAADLDPSRPEASGDDGLVLECSAVAPESEASLDEQGVLLRGNLGVSYRGAQGVQRSFVMPVYACAPGSLQKIGVTPVGSRVVVWSWDPEQTMLGVALHDRNTGTRIGRPWVVRGEPYIPPTCGVVYSSTRPVPVLLGDSLLVALVWGDGQGGLLFEHPGEFGKMTRPLDLGAWDVHDEAMPPVLVLVDEELRGVTTEE